MGKKLLCRSLLFVCMLCGSMPKIITPESDSMTHTQLLSIGAVERTCYFHWYSGTYCCWNCPGSAFCQASINSVCLVNQQIRSIIMEISQLFQIFHWKYQGSWWNCAICQGPHKSKSCNKWSHQIIHSCCMYTIFFSACNHLLTLSP